MKKILLSLGLIATIGVLSACSESEKEQVVEAQAAIEAEQASEVKAVEATQKDEEKTMDEKLAGYVERIEALEAELQSKYNEKDYSQSDETKEEWVNFSEVDWRSRVNQVRTDIDEEFGGKLTKELIEQYGDISTAAGVLLRIKDQYTAEITGYYQNEVDKESLKTKDYQGEFDKRLQRAKEKISNN